MDPTNQILQNWVKRLAAKSADPFRRVVWSNGPRSYSLEVGYDIPALGRGRSPPDSSPVRKQAVGISPSRPLAELTPYFCSSSCERSVQI